MIVHPLHFSYAFAEVTEGFDKRGVVSQSRVEHLASLISRLTRHRGPTEPLRILDLGCGTGRFAIPLAYARPNFELTAADGSAQLLARACSKPHADRIKWVVADAHRMPFADNQFDVVFMSDTFHHFDRPQTVVRECARILVPGGWLINKYGSIEDIIHDPEHVFFPSAIEIDLQRTPTRKKMESFLANIGMREILSETRTERTRISGRERLEAARAKSVSVLYLISKDDYDRGLAQLADYVERHPHSGWLMVDPVTFTFGRKPVVEERRLPDGIK